VVLTLDIGIKSFFSACVGLIVFYALGDLIYRAFHKKPFPNAALKLFWNCFIGMLLAISVYAIAISAGKTILLIVPVFIFFLVKYLHGYQTKSYSDNLKRVLVFSLFSLVVYYGFFLQGFFTKDPAAIKFPGGAHLYYARLAEFFNATGREIPTPEYFFYDTHSLSPYHYADIWLCALISKFSLLPAEFIQVLVIYPILSCLSVVGVAGIVMEETKKKIDISYIIVTLGLFYTGFRFLLPAIPDFQTANLPSELNYSKTLIVVPFILSAIIVVNQKNHIAFSIISALAAISFINVFPAFALSAIIFLLVEKLKGNITRTLWIISSLIVALSAVYLFSFYFIAQTGSESKTSNIIQISGVAGAMKFIFEGGVLNLIPLAPFVFLMFYLYRRIKFKVVLKYSAISWCCLLLICGLLISAFTQATVESFQFYYNVLVPIISISITVVLFSAFQLRSNLLRSIVIILVISLSIQNRTFSFSVFYTDKKEFNQLKSFIGNETKKVFVTYAQPESFADIYQKNTRLFYPFLELNYLYTPYINESLNTAYMLRDSTRHYTQNDKFVLRGSSSFENYVSANKKSSQDLANLENKFIDTIKADFLIIQKSNPPHQLQRKFKDSLVLSRYTVYRIR
jgi:hypothetical protein